MKTLLRRVLPVLLCLLLCACGIPAEIPTTTPADVPDTLAPSSPPATTTQPPIDFVFSRQNMPRLDGSTSTAPLAEAVCSALLGESREEIADLVHFSKTSNAYFRLISGNADLLIVGEDNAEIRAEKERLGFEWERQPFATDAFIFVVNESNPVDSITIEQAKRIYTGEITNWSELGGEDREIVAFQRNGEAGSQNLMEKLVMQGTPMMEAPTGYVVATMGDLMKAVKSYDGSPGAIGYTVYYYAQEMKMATGLKILALEGVEPNPDTIRAEEYPLLNPKYVVIPASAPMDAPNRILFNWLLSEEGQQLVAGEGYVAIKAPPGGRADPLPAIGTRWYDEYTDSLIPRDDYGELIPYAGLRLLDNWPAITGCMYGLMTKDGVAVTDAVYSNVIRPIFDTKSGLATHPLLVLSMGEQLGESGSVVSKIAVAASDGSWCTEFIYRFFRQNKNGLVLFSDDGITLMSPRGEILNYWSMADIGLSEEEAETLFNNIHWHEGLSGSWEGDYLALGTNVDYTEVDLFNLTTSLRETMTPDEWYAYGAERVEFSAQPQQAELLALLPPGDYRSIDFCYDWFAEDCLPGIITASQFNNELTLVFLADGTPMPHLSHQGERWYTEVRPVGGLIEILDLYTASYYNPDTMEWVFRAYLGYESD